MSEETAYQVDVNGKKVILDTTKLSDDITKIDVEDIMNVHIGNIQGEKDNIARYLLLIGLAKATCQAELSKIENAIRWTFASLSQQFRESLARANGNKKPPEEQIKQAVYNDQHYQELNANRVSAEKRVFVFDTVYWAVQSKLKLFEGRGAGDTFAS